MKPPVNALINVWYGTGADLPMGPISAVVDKHIGHDQLDVRILEDAWLRKLNQVVCYVTVYACSKVQRIAEDAYAWFPLMPLRWQGIPAEDGTISTFNLEGVHKLQLVSGVEPSDYSEEVLRNIRNILSTKQGRVQLSMLLRGKVQEHMTRRFLEPPQQIPDASLAVYETLRVLEEWQKQVIDIQENSSPGGDFTDGQAYELASKATELANSGAFHHVLALLRAKG